MNRVGGKGGGYKNLDGAIKEGKKRTIRLFLMNDHCEKKNLFAVGVKVKPIHCTVQNGAASIIWPWTNLMTITQSYTSLLIGIHDSIETFVFILES